MSLLRDTHFNSILQDFMPNRKNTRTLGVPIPSYNQRKINTVFDAKIIPVARGHQRRHIDRYWKQCGVQWIEKG